MRMSLEQASSSRHGSLIVFHYSDKCRTLMPYRLLGAALAQLLCFHVLAAPIPAEVTVRVDRPGQKISPMLHGIFFEDINFAADGGLYAELVQNRSFEHGDAFVGWGLVNRRGSGVTTIASEAPLNDNNPHYARLSIADAGAGFGLASYGYAGIAVRGGEKYLLSLQARASQPIPIRVVLEDESGRNLGSLELRASPSNWQALEGVLTASQSAANARLVVMAGGAGQLDLDMISLFPEQTFKQRRNGMRADLAEKIARLQPAFMRFPGGCIVEGENLATRYQWKHTIGDLAQRRQNENRWQDAIKTHQAPHYHQSYGLGFFEYFQFSEDIGAKPVPILNVGMACQYQSGELVPLDALDPYVQDALDLIEFANGVVTSPWGAKRAAMGHPAPFNLEYLGIGNEQWGEAYFERYEVFAKAIRARYPNIKLVSGAGPGVDDKSWALAWTKFRKGTPAHVVDEHYYRPPQWFVENATRYDRENRQCPVNKERSCPAVFAGEFAAHDTSARLPSLRAAVSEAAFMTGLLRNSDHVLMSSYAPLLARAGAYQWAPDLIWFDNTRVYGTPSYYTQLLFSQNRPDVLVPAEVAGAPVDLPRLPPKAVATYGAVPLPPYSPDSIPTLYASAGLNERRDEVVLFLVNPFGEPRAANIKVQGARLGAQANISQLTAASPDAVNSFEAPEAVAPKTSTVPLSGATITNTLPAYSLTVMRLPIVEAP